METFWSILENFNKSVILSSFGNIKMKINMVGATCTRNQRILVEAIIEIFSFTKTMSIFIPKNFAQRIIIYVAYYI